MTTIYLVRHAESEGNRFFRETGQRIPPSLLQSDLTVEGLEQVRALKTKLAGVSFDAVYSSHLLRALKTAELLRPEGIPLQILWELREKSSETESDEEAIERFSRVLNFISEKNAKKTILIVSHGFMIRSFLANVLHEPLENWPAGAIANASCAVVTYARGTYTVEVNPS